MSAIEDIATWANSKHNWWRFAMQLALNEGKLTVEHYERIHAIAKMEHGLIEIDADYQTLIGKMDVSGFVDEQDQITLGSLCDVKGVAALAEDQSLIFAKEGINIVYGDNGAGKSSYTGILKNTCLTRGIAPLVKSNVFNTVNPAPEATLNINVNDDLTTVVWSEDCESNPSLKSIRVFDSSSAFHYVNDEGGLSIKPIGIHVLTELVGAINYIKGIIEEDIQPGNGIINLNPLKNQNESAIFYNSISAKTNVDDIKNHECTDAEISSIEPLRKSILELSLQSVETIRKKLKGEILALTPLKDFCDEIIELLGKKNIENIKSLQNEFKAKSIAAENLRELTLGGLPIQGVANQEWVHLWEGAKNFILNSESCEHFPMKKGDVCPLCLQGINDESESRLAKLHDFLNNNASTLSRLAKSRYQTELNKILNKGCDFTPYFGVKPILDSYEDGLGDKLNIFSDGFLERKEYFKAELFEEQPKKIRIDFYKSLLKIIDNINDLIQKLQDDANTKSIIESKQKQLELLLDKKIIKENRSAIESNISRYIEIEKLKRIYEQCNTQSISVLSAALNRQTILAKLVDCFNNELNDFNFDRFEVKIQSRNRGGEQQVKLIIDGASESTVSKVASEGEQRCIAIANFLAEIKAENRRSGVIFDDPVNSLSHQWMMRVAKRLVKESLERQVIVFTHDIVFYKYLLENVDALNASCKCLTLERTRQYSGIVRETAPWDALTTSKRISQLNVKLQSLRKIDITGTVSEFRSASRDFYGYLREAWERLIEEKLLNKVITRFERSVQTQRLTKVLDITQDDISKITNAMSKCSTYFTGHDSANAVGDPYPNIKEIEDDLKEISEYVTSLTKDRKRS